MSETKHTPGPWIHSNEKGQGHQIRAHVPYLDREVEIQHVPIKPSLVVGNDGKVYAVIEYETCTPIGPSCWLEMQAANARLIAAAPELLAAAELFLSPYLKEYCAGSDAEIDRLRAAIAKAKGG